MSSSRVSMVEPWARGCLVISNSCEVLLCCLCSRQLTSVNPKRLSRLLVALRALGGQQRYWKMDVGGVELVAVDHIDFILALVPHTGSKKVSEVEALHFGHLMSLLYAAELSAAADDQAARMEQISSSYSVAQEMEGHVELELEEEAATRPPFDKFEAAYLRDALSRAPACEDWLRPLAACKNVADAVLLDVAGNSSLLSCHPIDEPGSWHRRRIQLKNSSKLWSRIQAQANQIGLFSGSEGPMQKIDSFGWKVRPCILDVVTPTDVDSLEALIQPVSTGLQGLDLCLILFFARGVATDVSSEKPKVGDGFVLSAESRKRSASVPAEYSECIEAALTALQVAFPHSDTFSSGQAQQILQEHLPLAVPPKKKQKSSENLSEKRFVRSHLSNSRPSSASETRSSTKKLEPLPDRLPHPPPVPRFKAEETGKKPEGSGEVQISAQPQTVRSSRLWSEFGFDTPRKEPNPDEANPFSLVKLYEGTPDKGAPKPSEGRPSARRLAVELEAVVSGSGGAAQSGPADAEMFEDQSRDSDISQEATETPNTVTPSPGTILSQSVNQKMLL